MGTVFVTITHMNTEAQRHISSNMRTKHVLFSGHYPLIFPVDHNNTVHTMTFGLWCSKHEGNLKSTTATFHKNKNAMAMIMQRPHCEQFEYYFLPTVHLHAEGQNSE